MTLSSASFEDSKTFNGEYFRQFAGDLVDNGLGLLSAVFSGFRVSQQTSPGNTIKVAAGRLSIAATESGKHGGYPVANDASVNSGVFTATSGNGRKDRLILRVTSGVPALEIVAGTAAGTPLEPAITGDNYIELALITLPPSTTNVTDAMITDRRFFGGKWAQPWGCLAAVTGTAAVAGSTPSTATIITAPTLTLIQNRRIEISYATLGGIASGGLVLANWELVRDTSVIQSWMHTVAAATANEQVSWDYVDVAPPAGSHSYFVRWSSNVSSSGVDQASSTYKRQLIVSDVGPAANPD